MSRLPDELVSLRALQRLDISHNSFVALPRPAVQAPSLITLNASHNHIIGNYLYVSIYVKRLCTFYFIFMLSLLQMST